MAIKGTLDGITQLAPGIWDGRMRWSENLRLGTPLQAIGLPTVIMVRGAEYDAGTEELRFPLDQVSVLNAGSGERAVFISANGSVKTRNEATPQPEAMAEPKDITVDLSKYGTGDHEFEAALSMLSDRVMQAGEEILQKIRERFPGDLKPYPRRRFFNTPDNFWGVEIQTRLQLLKFTVRGKPERFGSSSLKIWLDRPPVYSAFKVSCPDDVDEAVRIISQADRKDI